MYRLPKLVLETCASRTVSASTLGMLTHQWKVLDKRGLSVLSLCGPAATEGSESR